MTSCCVPNCHMRQRKAKLKTISYHEFPSDFELRKRWIRNISRENWVPRDGSRVCSLHFLQSDFRSGLKHRMLKKGATPSVFSGYPKYHQDAATKRRTRQSLLLSQSLVTQGDAEPSVNDDGNDANCETNGEQNVAEAETSSEDVVNSIEQMDEPNELQDAPDVRNKEEGNVIVMSSVEGSTITIQNGSSTPAEPIDETLQESLFSLAQSGIASPDESGSAPKVTYVVLTRPQQDSVQSAPSSLYSKGRPQVGSDEVRKKLRLCQKTLHKRSKEVLHLREKITDLKEQLKSLSTGLEGKIRTIQSDASIGNRKASLLLNIIRLYGCKRRGRSMASLAYINHIVRSIKKPKGIKSIVIM